MKKISFISLVCFLIGSCARPCDFIQFNKCYSCREPLSFLVGSGDSCGFLCPNRQAVFHETTSGFYCALKKCPPEFPFQSPTGGCFSSFEKSQEIIPVTLPENTNETNIRESEHSIDSVNATTDTVSGSALNTKPLQRWDDTYFSCYEEKAIRISSECNLNENCEDICPNRTILYQDGGNPPSIPNCPPDRPLMDKEGICYPCQANVPIGLEHNTRLCSRFCSKERHLDGTDCVLN